MACPANVPALKDARVSPSFVNESTVTPASESLEFPTNVVLASESLEFPTNVVPASSDGATNAKSRSVFVQGTSCALDDTIGVTAVGSERASSNPSDVVVALSAGKKGDGSLPSSAADEEAAANPYGGVWYATLVAPSLGKTDCRCVVVHPADPDSCHPPKP
ncbi:hypothetical protein Tco_0279332, partial [Tanacetum coccineum]